MTSDLNTTETKTIVYDFTVIAFILKHSTVEA